MAIMAVDLLPQTYDEWAVQFLGQISDGGRECYTTLFAPSAVPAFKTGETVALGVPWLLVITS